MLWVVKSTKQQPTRWKVVVGRQKGALPEDRFAAKRDGEFQGRAIDAQPIGSAMKKFTITIVADSTETYRSQLLEIESAPDKVEIGDGTARRRQQIKVFWEGGKAAALSNAKNVKLLDENRGFAFDGELSSRSRPPRDLPEGVEFFLVRAA